MKSFLDTSVADARLLAFKVAGIFLLLAVSTELFAHWFLSWMEAEYSEWAIFVGTAALLAWLVQRSATVIRQKDEWLRQVARGLSVTGGEAVFPLLAQNLAQAFAADGAVICELTGDGKENLRTLAAWSGGRLLDNFECPWVGTPFEAVLRERRMVCVPHGMRDYIREKHLPEDLFSESIIGTPLFDAAGHAVGLLAVFDRSSLCDRAEAEDILPLFAVRAAAEIERKRAEEKIEMLNANLAARASELEAANKELEAFNYTVSDDLRKPIININSFCQVIQELCGSALDERCSGYLRNIYDRTLQMSHRIDTLLSFSRLSSGKVCRETVDLGALAKAVATELRMAEPERRVTFRIAEGLTANGDPRLLWMVLEKLLDNAWKYTGKREEAVIEIGMAEVEGNPAYFVRDNGTGFDMTQAEKLFLPFQRPSGADEYRGHGIGLATVARIVGRHGGRVWAEGEPGKGATFYFTVRAEER